MLGGKVRSQMCMPQGRLENFEFPTSFLHILKHFTRVAVRETIMKSFGVSDTAVTAMGGLFRYRKFLGHDPKAFYIHKFIRTC